MKRILLGFALALLGTSAAKSQTTVQITTGTAGTPAYNAGPIYRSSASSAYDASRYAYLYTQDELAAVGINSGDLITELGWVKNNNATTIGGGGVFRIYMKNSVMTTYGNASETWANLNAGTDLVYENLNQTVPATQNPAYIVFTLSAPFMYTGGSLEISTEWDINQVSGNPSSGTFDWMWSTVPNRIYGTGQTGLGNAATLSSTTNSISTIDDRRPFLQIGYIPGTACAGAPTGGTANASQSAACSGTSVSLTVAGATLASGLSYQWQSSPDGFVWSDISGATGGTYSPVIVSTLSYRRRIICSAGPDTAYSSVVQVALSPFLDCYCTSNATATTNASIRNVTLTNGNINNTSAGACDQYTDFSSITGVVNKGISYPVSVLVEDCEGATFGTQRVAIFVDWNQDGDFTDADELVYDPGTLPGAATVQFSGSFTVPVTATTGITKMRVINKQATTVIDPCGTYTTGETEDYLLNVLPAPANEAGVSEITRPAVASCSLGNQIWVNLQNMGSDPLTQANFTVRINGISVPVSNPWTGNVPPQGEAEIQLPLSYSLADGDSISVQVSMPNGVAEDTLFGFNNLTTRVVWAGLTGIKTVNGPAGANNFVNMDAALTALGQRGVCDTVTFRITAGTYNSQHVFTEYPGAGAGRLAVFESATGNAADVIFVDSNTVTAENYIFRFDGGDGYMLRHITGIAKGATYSRVVDILNGADDLTFEDNVFIGDTVATYSTSDFGRVVVASANSTDDHRTVLRNNLIQGGNRGVNLGGATGSYETGIRVEGNTIEKYAYIGMILGQTSGFEVTGNVFRPRENLTQDAFGAYVNGSIQGGTIEKNDVISNRNGSSVTLINVKGALLPVSVKNNFLYQGDTSATGLSRGIQIQDVNTIGVRVVNNSVATYSNNPSGGAITVLDGSEIEIFNNNVGSFGNAPVLRVDKPYSIEGSDHNNFFGARVAHLWGTDYTTLADLQAATSRDVNSLSVTPGFTGTDLHTCAPELNAAGMAFAEVNDDFDGNGRSATPDIGADEFLGGPEGLLADDDFLKCPADAVTLGNGPIDGVTYSWSPSGSTSEISVTAAGTYIVTATSACGSFSDTAVVVNKPLPVAGFSLLNVGLTGVFTNTSTGGTSYLWDFGDGQTSTEFSPSHVYNSAGTYSVTLTVTNECGSDTHGPLPVTVVNAGIEEAAGNLQVSLFPNPTDGLFTVTVDGLGSAATVLTVIDVTGKVVTTHNLPAGVNQVTLDATEFASGVYSVKISNSELQKVIRLVRN